jgi:hypothetical protein
VYDRPNPKGNFGVVDIEEGRMIAGAFGWSDELRMGKVGIALWKSNRKPARGVHLAEENVGNRRASANSRIPGFQYGAHLIDPGHQKCSAGFGHNDGVWISGGHLTNQIVLVARQFERGQIGVFVGELMDKHNGDIGLPGKLRRSGRISAVVIEEIRMRGFGEDCQKW